MASIYTANDAAAYEQSMGRWSRRLAEAFGAFAAVPDGACILDVGCGTGSLIFALAAALPAARLTGLDYSQAFVDYAAVQAPAGGRISFEQGDAAALPYADESFDAALSLLVLNFVPDAQQAARELVRVTRRGGIAAAAVWDFRGGLVFIRLLVDTAAALDPSGEAVRSKLFSGPFTRPGEFAATWRALGLRDVTQTALTIRTEFSSFADLWGPWVGGQGIVGAYVTSLSADLRARLERAVRLAYLAGDPDGPRSFAATAWACRGIK
jgi:SAM-dependent methyltransferase